MDLDKAFRDGDDEVIIRRLQESYDIENDPEELLLRAAHYGRDSILEACLKKGIDPDSHCALTWACGKGRIGPIKTLLSAGANIDLKDELGRSPLIKSTGSGKLNEVRFLIKNGAGHTGALVVAVSGEYTGVVKFLIGQGVDLEECDDNGLTPLSIACASGTKKAAAIAHILIGADANVNYVRESDEMTPLKFAAGNSSPEVIQALIDNGAEIDGPAGTDQTALMCAARADSVPNTAVLLRNGADPQIQCGLKWAENRTAQGLAEMEECREVIAFLAFDANVGPGISIEEHIMHIEQHSNQHIKQCLQVAAKADAMICNEDYLRCYEFHADWADGIEMAKYDTGGGDDIFIVFVGDAAILKGFDHESMVSPHEQEPFGVFPGIYDGAPEYLLEHLRDDAIEFEEVTFCYWRESNDGPWLQGPVALNGLDDGSTELLPRVITCFAEYDRYAREYFESDYSQDLAKTIRTFFPSE